MKRLIVMNALLLLVLFVLMSVSNNRLQDDAWPVPAKYSKMENPYANDKDSDQIGKELFMVQCKSCHGSKGLGDGTKASTLDTPVPDLTTDEFKSQTDGEIYYKSIFGKDDMPSFEKKIKEEEDRWLLVNYLKNL
jgi:mono/diheme cytochrome c family protein